MKQILTIIFALSLTIGKAQLKSQLPKNSDETLYQDYQACTECFEKWKTNVVGQKTTSQSNNSLANGGTGTKAKTFLQSKGKIIIGIVSVAVVGAIAVYVTTKSTNIANALSNP